MAEATTNSWLFMLHKGPGASQQLFSQAFNGQEWTGDVVVAGTGGISYTPAAVVLNSNLYAFYQRDHVFYYKVYDGEVWTAEAQVPDTAGVANGVAAAVLDGTIFLLYSNPGSTDLKYMTYDGTNFGAETSASITFQNLDTPAATVFGNTLYVFGRGPGANEPNNVNRFWYATWYGSWWRAHPVSGTRGISNGPGAIGYNAYPGFNMIYVFYNEPDGTFSYQWFDGNNDWSSWRGVLNTPGCAGNPAAAVYQETLYLLYQGPSDGQFLYNTCVADPTTGMDDWSNAAPVPNTSGISTGPAATVLSL